MFIESSKTDKYRDGAWVVVAVSEKVTCPVNMMNRYFVRLSLVTTVLFFAGYLRLNMAIKLELEVLATRPKLRELVIEALLRLFLNKSVMLSPFRGFSFSIRLRRP